MWLDGAELTRLPPAGGSERLGVVRSMPGGCPRYLELGVPATASSCDRSCKAMLLEGTA